ncbi:MAG: Eco57I restriction-modification methylase domain-containing protein [Myxococcota bacterium]|nr:Eco57I restriction-modification methylase domain-containing protein [Myxococcota bacterium]
MHAIDSIGKLVAKYEKLRDGCLKSTYKEEQLRTDCLNQFIKLLGWDLDNNRTKSTYEREVLVEEGLKEKAGSHTKKPDFTFRRYRERKFFVEAKKPSVCIERERAPALQVRTYGIMGRLKISVLTNFEYLAIYDCSVPVQETDTVETARINIFHYTEYEESFSQLQRLLGRESVYSGEFDQVWSNIEDRLKRFNINDLFLKDLNDWRSQLGAEIFRLNRGIQQEALNDTVQRIINSILFLRVCEDRHLEDYKSLLKLADERSFKGLQQLFVDADRRYNAGLFEPLAEASFNERQSAFWRMIKRMYFPESTYAFAVLSSSILGDIYELFLAQHLVIRNGAVQLESLPENSNRDIVTTPTYIVHALLDKTVRQRCRGMNPEQILEMKFADIACGSGAFLLELFQLLNDLFIDHYLENDPGHLIQVNSTTYKLPFDMKKDILERCIYGVDQNLNAVEACKFGLLLKLLENEEQSSVGPSHVLPSLDENIIWGNSLVRPCDLASDDDFNVINPYEFPQKFDVIVGNPPYMATGDMKRFTPSELPIYKTRYRSAYKQFDKYYLFIERSLELLDDDGKLGYIVPHKFCKVGAATPLRRLLSEGRHLAELTSFGAIQLFDEKTTYTALIVLSKDARECFEYTEVKSLNDWRQQGRSREVTTIETATLDEEVWILMPASLQATYDSIQAQSGALGSVLGADSICNGIQTSANKVYVHKPTLIDDDYVRFQKDGKTWEVERKLTRPYFKTEKGPDNLNTYREFKPNAIVIYPYTPTDSSIALVSLKTMESDFPRLYEYLRAHEPLLNHPKRDIKPVPETTEEWHRYGRHQSLEKCAVSEKIIVGVLSAGNKYAVDVHGTLITSGGTAGYCMITLPDQSEYSIYYIQALLNSKYLEWCSSLLGEVFRGGFIARGTKVLKRLPIRTIDFGNTDDVQRHDRIVALQKSLIEDQKQIDQNSGNRRALIPLQRRFNTRRNALDAAIQQLYGFDDAVHSSIPSIGELYTE